MKLAFLSIRAISKSTGAVIEKDIFFVPTQLTMIKPNDENDEVSMVKIGGEYFAVNGTPIQVNEKIKSF